MATHNFNYSNMKQRPSVFQIEEENFLKWINLVESSLKKKLSDILDVPTLIEKTSANSKARYCNLIGTVRNLKSHLRHLSTPSVVENIKFVINENGNYMGPLERVYWIDDRDIFSDIRLCVNEVLKSVKDFRSNDLYRMCELSDTNRRVHLTTNKDVENVKDLLDDQRKRCQQSVENLKYLKSRQMCLASLADRGIKRIQDKMNSNEQVLMQQLKEEEIARQIYEAAKLRRIQTEDYIRDFKSILPYVEQQNSTLQRITNHRIELESAIISCREKWIFHFESTLQYLQGIHSKIFRVIGESSSNEGQTKSCDKLCDKFATLLLQFRDLRCKVRSHSLDVTYQNSLSEIFSEINVVMCLPKKRNINSIDVLLDDRGGEGKGEGDLLIKAEIMASFFGRLGLELTRMWKQHNEPNTYPDSLWKCICEFEAFVHENLRKKENPQKHLALISSHIPLYSNSTVVLFFDRVQHDTPSGHVECAERVETSLSFLKGKLSSLAHSLRHNRYNYSNNEEKMEESVKMLNCNDVVSPPLWILPIVHSPVYLQKLQRHEERVREERLYALPLDITKDDLNPCYTDQDETNEEEISKNDLRDPLHTPYSSTHADAIPSKKIAHLLPLSHITLDDKNVQKIIYNTSINSDDNTFISSSIEESVARNMQEMKALLSVDEEDIALASSLNKSCFEILHRNKKGYDSEYLYQFPKFDYHTSVTKNNMTSNPYVHIENTASEFGKFEGLDVQHYHKSSKHVTGAKGRPRKAVSTVDDFKSNSTIGIGDNRLIPSVAVIIENQSNMFSDNSQQQQQIVDTSISEPSHSSTVLEKNNNDLNMTSNPYVHIENTISEFGKFEGLDVQHYHKSSKHVTGARGRPRKAVSTVDNLKSNSTIGIDVDTSISEPSHSSTELEKNNNLIFDSISHRLVGVGGKCVEETQKPVNISVSKELEEISYFSSVYSLDDDEVYDTHKPGVANPLSSDRDHNYDDFKGLDISEIITNISKSPEHSLAESSLPPVSVEITSPLLLNGGNPLIANISNRQDGLTYPINFSKMMKLHIPLKKKRAIESLSCYNAKRLKDRYDNPMREIIYFDGIVDDDGGDADKHLPRIRNPPTKHILEEHAVVFTDDYVFLDDEKSKSTRNISGAKKSFMDYEVEEEENRQESDTRLMDTYLGKYSFQAALCVAGSVCRGVDITLSGNNTNVFCCMRPPGHHAGRYGRTDGAFGTGFCLLNHAAIASVYARTRWGLSKVAIVDIDVHFGNGTYELVKDDPRTFFASVHMIHGPDNKGFTSQQLHACCRGANTLKADVIERFKDGFYPHDMGCYEVRPTTMSLGVYPALFQKKNVAAAAAAFDPNKRKYSSSMDNPAYHADHAGSNQPPNLYGPQGFRRAIKEYIIPAMEAYKPELLIISAGFDGYKTDPLGSDLELSTEDYSYVTRELVLSMNRMTGSGRVVSLLEGGYDVAQESLGLASCVDAHVKALSI